VHATPQHDVDTQPTQGALHCERPSAMGRTNRTETCRLLADFERFSAIIAQHGEGVAPELASELRAMKPVSPDLAAIDAALWRTAGPSSWLRGRLTGGDWYVRTDGTRLLLANPPMVAELWQLH